MIVAAAGRAQALVFTLLVVCGSAVVLACKDEPTGTLPADPVERYLRLTSMESTLEYTVLFNLVGHDGDLRRTRRAGWIRWDDVLGSKVEGGFAGSVEIEHDGTWNTCLWGVSIGKPRVEVSCSGNGASRWEQDFRLLLAPPREMLEVSEFTHTIGEVAGKPAECFAVRNNLVRGAVCFTAAGIPVLFQTAGLDEQLEWRAEATDVRDAATGIDVEMQIVQGLPSTTFPVTEFPLDALSLPDLPRIDELWAAVAQTGD